MICHVTNLYEKLLLGYPKIKGQNYCNTAWRKLQTRNAFIGNTATALGIKLDKMAGTFYVKNLHIMD